MRASPRHGCAPPPSWGEHSRPLHRPRHPRHCPSSQTAGPPTGPSRAGGGHHASQALAIFARDCCNSFHTSLPASTASPPNPSTTEPESPCRNVNFGMLRPWPQLALPRAERGKALPWPARQELPQSCWSGHCGPALPPTPRFRTPIETSSHLNLSPPTATSPMPTPVTFGLQRYAQHRDSCLGLLQPLEPLLLEDTHPCLRRPE